MPMAETESATSDELAGIASLQAPASETAPAATPDRLGGGLDISVSQGLTILKEMWNASSRLAKLQEEYKGQKIPIEKVFGALLGFGDKPDPLAEVKQKLDEINRKLDRVLAGIQEIQMGLLGLGVLTVYLDIADSVFLIEKYSESLLGYVGGDATMTDADRKDFIDKLLGAKSERDGVSFCAQKIIKLGPGQTPLLFDLLFPYIATGATPDTAATRYMKGAYVFRFVADVLLKGLILEIFAVTATGDQTKMSVRAEKVVKKYQGWLRAMIDNSFLPFAEKLATLNFKDEFLGGNDTRDDANFPLNSWSPQPASSILLSADELVARLMGRSKGLMLRVIPNVPPLAEKVPAARPTGAVYSGKHHWEVTNKPSTTLTRESALDAMSRSTPPFFMTKVIGAGNFVALNVSRADIAFMDGAAIPPGFDKSKLSFLRYEFDLSSYPERTQLAIYLGNTGAASAFPLLLTTWRRIYVEGGQRFPEEEKTFQQFVLDKTPGIFDLPAGGQVSPVLTTYAYNMFGQRRGTAVGGS